MLLNDTERRPATFGDALHCIAMHVLANYATGLIPKFLLKGSKLGRDCNQVVQATSATTLGRFG